MKTQILSGLKWQSTEVVVRQLLSIVTFALLARLLDEKAFGLIGLMTVFIAFINILSEQGLSSAIVQQKDLTEAHTSSAFWTNMAASTWLYLMVLAFAGVIAVLFQEPELAALLRVGGLSLLVNASVMVHSALFIKHLDFKKRATRNILANLTGGAVGVAMAYSGFGVWALIGQQLGVSISGALYIWFASTWRPIWYFDFASLRELMSVSFSEMCTTLLWFSAASLDYIILGTAYSAAIIGLYAIADKITGLIHKGVQQPVAAIAMPALAKLKGKPQEMASALYRAGQLNGFVGMLIFGGLIATAPTAVSAVFGDKWLPAISLVQLLGLTHIVMSIFVFSHPALLASGGEWRALSCNAVFLAWVLATGFIAVRHSPELLVAMRIAAASLSGVLSMYFLRNLLKLNVVTYLRSYITPLVAAGSMVATLTAFRGLTSGYLALYTWVQLLLEVLIGLVVYLAAFAALDQKRLVEHLLLIPQLTTRNG